MQHPMIFQIASYLSNSIGEMLMGMISQVRWETRELVDLATLWPLHKLLSLDLSWNMEKSLHNYHHNSYSIAIIWQKDAKEDGLISTPTLLKMDILYQKTVLLISTKLLIQNAPSSNTAQELPKSRNPMMLVVHMDFHLRSKWWKRSFVMVFSTLSSKLQQFSQPTKTVLLPQKASMNFMLSHSPRLRAKKQLIFQMILSLARENLGRSSITQLCS